MHCRKRGAHFSTNKTTRPATICFRVTAAEKKASVDNAACERRTLSAYLSPAIRESHRGGRSNCETKGFTIDLMRPFPAEPMRMWPISTRVNKPESGDPSIIEPIELSAAYSHYLFAGRLFELRGPLRRLLSEFSHLNSSEQLTALRLGPAERAGKPDQQERSVSMIPRRTAQDGNDGGQVLDPEG